MTAFTLVVTPDGRAILASSKALDHEETEAVRDVVRSWDEGKYPVLIVNDCDVIQVTSIEIDLEPKTEVEP